MRRIIIMILTLLLGAALSVADEPGQHGRPPVQDPRFDFLKQLEGTWTATGGGEGMSGTTFEFRVTAGGHAVEEREMIGTPMEMLTVYYMEGKDLVAKHFCMLGNQPRLKAAAKVADGTLDFTCDGKPGNSGSHAEEHVHAWSMKLGEDDKLHYTAELVKEGAVSEAPVMTLVRQQKTAAR